MSYEKLDGFLGASCIVAATPLSCSAITVGRVGLVHQYAVRSATMSEALCREMHIETVGAR